MESIVFDHSPLAEYLREQGSDTPPDWIPAVLTPSTSAADVLAQADTDSDTGAAADDASSRFAPALPFTPDQPHKHAQASQPGPSSNGFDTPPPSPPSPSFAPVGRPMVRKRFRNKVPSALKVTSRRSPSLSDNRYCRAVASTLGRADSTQFIEKFRYTIITSLLLGPSTLGPHPHVSFPSDGDGSDGLTGGGGGGGAAESGYESPLALNTTSVTVGAAGVVTATWVVSWLVAGGLANLAKKRVLVSVLLLAAAALLGGIYVRQQRLQSIRQATLDDAKAFVARSHDFDSAASAAIAFIKEVELVSRGYRISAPLPPISRMDERSQSRRCLRLRKAVRSFFAEALPRYIQTTDAIKGFTGESDLEMYYHVYDISDFDISDALQGYSEAEFDDADSIRTLTVLAARFHTVRKMFLCALLALEPSTDDADLVRWTTAAEGLHGLTETARVGYERLRMMLGDAGTFPAVATPSKDRAPLSPGRERWRSQLGKLNSLSTGIRGLQAKLALLREESDQTLNAADDLTQLGPDLMAQYESIGQDLKLLVQAWEEGRSVLASGINRNEKRLSSMSAMLASPTLSPSVRGLAGVVSSSASGAGTAEDALRALTGSPTPLDGSTVVGDADEDGVNAAPAAAVVFEAVAQPASALRRRSLLTREERMARMKEDRERRAEVREQADANRGMLRELEMVINLRPKTGQPAKAEEEKVEAKTDEVTNADEEETVEETPTKPEETLAAKLEAKLGAKFDVQAEAKHDAKSDAPVEEAMPEAAKPDETVSPPDGTL